MATAKPKRMMFGGIAKGAAKTAKPAAPMTQSSMQAAARKTSARQVPAAPMRNDPRMQAAAKAQQGARSVTPTPTMNKMYADFQAQKSGATGTGSQRVMKKGGAVKKAAKK